MHDRGSEASDTGDAGGRDRPQSEHESARRKPRSGSRGDRFARPIGATRFWIAVSIAGVGLSSIAMLIFALIVVVRTISMHLLTVTTLSTGQSTSPLTLSR